MRRPLGSIDWFPGAEHQTLHEVLLMAEEGWQLYPIYGVDADGVCACPKGATCPNPGKHPTTPHGFNDASSDPERIADMFARWPGENVGLKTGRASGTVIIDVDPRNGGMETLGRLQAEHGYLPPTRLHATGGGGFHYVLGYPEGVKAVPSRTIGPGVEVKADGAGVVLPPSIHASGGRYEVLINAPLAPLPSWVVEIARELRVLAGGAEQPTECRFKLPEHIYETASPRNRTLFDYGCSVRAHGWDHPAILAELRRVNAERCIPPMSDYEVQKIARSAARYQPGKALTVSPEVLAAVAYLEERAGHRAKKGLAAHSRWAIYRALLDCAKRHGRMHRGRDVVVRISVRRLGLDAGLGKTATQDALAQLDAAGLVYRVSRGNGRVPGSLALRVPDTDVRGTFVPPSQPLLTVPPSSVSETLYRLRHGPGRIGKSAAAVLEAVVECPGVSRAELAAKLGKKPDSLSRQLQMLVDRGLIERCGKGHCRPTDDWQQKLERERTLTGEKLAERLDEQHYEREREAYRRYLAHKEESSEAGGRGP
jgi:DNA-binding MarR family transcriptional regulator